MSEFFPAFAQLPVLDCFFFDHFSCCFKKVSTGVINDYFTPHVAWTKQYSGFLFSMGLYSRRRACPTGVLGQYPSTPPQPNCIVGFTNHFWRECSLSRLLREYVLYGHLDRIHLGVWWCSTLFIGDHWQPLQARDIMLFCGVGFLVHVVYNSNFPMFID